MPDEDPEVAYVYASELIDEDTCDVCRAADGRQYPTIHVALADYPDGHRGNINCTSLRGCRGCLIEVFVSEVPPTLMAPGGDP